jgi:hypothetical protein
MCISFLCFVQLCSPYSFILSKISDQFILVLEYEHAVLVLENSPTRPHVICLNLFVSYPAQKKKN